MTPKVAKSETCGIFQSSGWNRFHGALSAALQNPTFHGTLNFEVTIRDGKPTYSRTVIDQTDKQ